MLRIHDANNPDNVIPLLLEDDKQYVQHVYGGYDKLIFEISSNNQLYQYISEEVRIDDDNNSYIVKLIDEHSDFITVTCDLNLDDWKAEIFASFRTTNATLQNVLDLIIPDGWTESGASQFTKRTTIEDTDGEPLAGVNPLDILNKTFDVYSCVYRFNTLAKTVEVIDPDLFGPSGQFFSDELNLKSIGYTGESREFATRLYAYGKKDENGNPLTFASINDGKEYVEDYTYSDKVVSVGWSDERYTNKETLLADAKAKLAKLSFPVRSYACDVAAMNDDVWLYKVVTLIDRRRGTRINHRIVEYNEYPNHVADKIQLSSMEDRIESKIERVRSEIENDVDKKQSKTRSSLQEMIENVTETITGNKGGNFIWIFDTNGRPIELVNLGDTLDVSTARKVWRWNQSGLGYSSNGYEGPYTTAITANGEIVADFITAGTFDGSIIRAGSIEGSSLSTSYKSSVTNEIGEAVNTVEQTLVAADAQLQSQIDQTYTQEQTDIRIESTINQVADTIRSEVSEQYAKNGDVETLRSIVEQNADNVTISITGEREYAVSIDDDLNSFKDLIGTYFQFTDDGLIIAKPDSPFSTQYRDSKISFYQSGEEIAYVQYNQLFISNARFIQGITLGNYDDGSMWAFEIDDYGLGIVWRAGEV